MPDALQGQGAEGLQLEEPGDQTCGVAAHDDLTRLPRRLQAGRHVRDLTPDVGEPLLPAGGHGHDQDLTGVDARRTPAGR